MSKIRSVPKKNESSEEKNVDLEMRVGEKSNSQEQERLDQNKESGESHPLLEEEDEKKI